MINKEKQARRIRRLRSGDAEKRLLDALRRLDPERPRCRHNLDWTNTGMNGHRCLVCGQRFYRHNA